MKQFLYIILCLNFSYLIAQDTIPDIVLKGHKYTVNCIDFSENNKYLVSGGWDNTIKIWDYKKGKELKSFDVHEDMIRDVCFSNNNYLIASASRDKSIRIINIVNGDTKTITNDYKANVDLFLNETYFSSLTFTPDKKHLVFTVAGRDEIFIWDVANNKLSEKILAHNKGIYKVEISNSGKYLAGTSGDNSIIVWDMNTKKELYELKGHPDVVSALCFSNDDKFLVSGGGRNVVGRKPMNHYTLKIWDLSNGEEIKELQGHVDAVLKVRFTPNGKYVASASEDNSVRFWDVNSAMQIWKYETDCYFLSCDISPDGNYLAASSKDETIRIWNINKIIK